MAEIMSTLSLSLSLSQQTDLKYLEEDLLAKLSLRIIVQQTQSRSSPAFAKEITASYYLHNQQLLMIGWCWRSLSSKQNTIILILIIVLGFIRSENIDLE